MESTKAKDLATLFNQIPLEEIVGKSFQLFTLEDTDTVEDALRKFRDFGITSCPLINPDLRRVTSSIDMLDLVAYARAKLDLEHEKSTKSEAQQVEEFLSRSLRNLPYLSTRNPWFGIQPRKSLKKAIRLLSHPKCHRVYLAEGFKVTGVLTQSKVIEVMLSHKELIRELMLTPVKELWEEGKVPKSIGMDVPMLTAFKNLYEEYVTGLAVIDNEGVLRGNISASDLKYLNVNNPQEFLKNLNITVGEYIQKRPPVVVTPEDTMENVMEKINSNKVHRVYVVDKYQKPIQVISLVDIISQLDFFIILRGY